MTSLGGAYTEAQALHGTTARMGAKEKPRRTRGPRHGFRPDQARDKGLDYIGQTEHTVRAVLAVRPDMTASAAMQAVNRLRQG